MEFEIAKEHIQTPNTAALAHPTSEIYPAVVHPYSRTVPQLKHLNIFILFNFSTSNS